MKKKNEARQLLAPKPELIREIRAKEWAAEGCIAEVVDNSLEEGKGQADEVWITYTRRFIEIEDRGLGCDNIERLFQLGNSSSYERPGTIGLYGVGCTYASIWLGAKLIVETRHEGKVQTFSHSWNFDHPKWPDPAKIRTRKMRSGETTGTVFRVEQLENRGRNRYDRTRKLLGRLFAPAILTGRKIHFRSDQGAEFQEIAPYDTPPIDAGHRDAWNGSFEIDGVRYTYFAEVGWMVKPDSDFNSIQIAFTHRMLRPTKECFRAKQSPLITGSVYLGPEFKYVLNGTKDTIAREPVREALMEQVYEHLMPLIESANAQSKKLIIDRLRNRLNGSVNIRKSGGAREKGDRPIVEPNRRVRGSEKAQRSKSGLRDRKRGKAARSDSGIEFDFYSGDDPCKMVSVSLRGEKRILVLYNLDHPFIDSCTQQPQSDDALVGIGLSRAAHLLVEERKVDEMLPNFKPTRSDGVAVGDQIVGYLMEKMKFTKTGLVATGRTRS